MERVDASPEAFLASLPDDVRGTMTEVDGLIRSAMPGRTRTLWEGTFWGGSEQRILGYGDLVQPRPRGGSVEWFLVGLARQTRMFSIYVNAVEDGAYLLSRYADRLGKVKVGAASIGFKTLDDVDRESLEALLTRAHELALPDVP